MHLLLGFIGGVLGAGQSTVIGTLFGVLLGVLVAEIISLRKRIVLLESGIDVMPGGQETLPGVAEEALVDQGPPPEPVQWHLETSASASTPLQEEAPAAPVVNGDDDLSTGLLSRFGSLLTGGNMVLKTGVIVLFFGVAFLLKYGAQHHMISIEIRMISVAMAGILLLCIGWRLRNKTGGYGLVMQGAGVGILYLVLFTAAKIYSYLTPLQALVVMVGLVVFTGALALLQEAKSLAVFGIVGGFLAPVLMSSEGGNHLLLFSYYALLNSGILGIAWFKAWRELNILGFFFTFGIAVLWGSSHYLPELFWSTEPFLLLFFVFYVFIAVLFAQRQPAKRLGYIDATLVFGLPVLVSWLQYYLVGDMEYGLAYSSLGCGIFYLVQTFFLRNRFAMQPLADAFLALGVVFSSLAVPLAFDGFCSAAIWACQGAGMVWIGLRQGRVLSRHFGLLLQVGAAFFFVDSVFYPFSAPPFLNYYFFGCFLLAGSSLLSSYCFDRWLDNLQTWEGSVASIFSLWGLFWWYIGGVQEIHRHVAMAEALDGLLLFCTATSLFIGIIKRKVVWPHCDLQLKLQLPLMILLIVTGLVYFSYVHFWGGWGFTAWGIAFFAQYRILYLFAEQWSKRAEAVYHVCTLLLLLFLLCYEAGWWFDGVPCFSVVWAVICWAVIPAGVLLFLVYLVRFSFWPFACLGPVYLKGVGICLVAGLVCWILLSTVFTGDPAPLTYIPFINPLESSGFFAIFTIIIWARGMAGAELSCGYFTIFLSPWLPAGLLFFLLNCLLARTVHFFGAVLYLPQPLYSSLIFQAAIAVLWGVWSLVITVLATRRGSRSLWRVGAVLLALVVCKLFLVDLSGSGTIARIMSFLVVGILMLIIGYFSPQPPKSQS